MTLPPELAQAIDAEFSRLGLDRAQHGGLAFSGTSAAERFLTHLRSFSLGATWQDVLPGSPPASVPFDPSQWRSQYKPLGAWDYQTLPTGAAVHVIWHGPATEEWLSDLGSQIRGAGHPLYGLGRLESAGMPSNHAIVVLQAAAGREAVDEFLEWLAGQPNLELAGVPRRGDEQYVRRH